LIDMRYHVISLVAVLLALGIGILLGTTLVERGLISEQKSQITSLKKTFGEIKDKNNQLHEELTTYEDFASQVSPYLISNALVGRSLALIDTAGANGADAETTKKAIASAGGNVPVSIEMADPKVYSDVKVLNSLAQIFQMPADAEALRQRVYSEVANQLVTASNPAVLDALEKAGVLQMNGTLTGPLSGGIMLSSDEKADPDELAKSDVPLIKALVAVGFPLIGVGGDKTDDKVLQTYKANGISTADHINTVPGQTAMVMALSGRGGSYGTGSSADRLIPAPVVM